MLEFDRDEMAPRANHVVRQPDALHLVTVDFDKVHVGRVGLQQRVDTRFEPRSFISYHRLGQQG